MYFSRRVVQSTLRRAVVARRGFSSSSGGGGGGFGGVVALAAAGAAGYSIYELQEQKAAVADLQVQLAGKTNSAFVFVKPHAAHSDAVKALVEEQLKAKGIKITGAGEMSAEDIDKNMYIDTHYGAIASKAVKLQPSQLNVPEKGQAEFAKMFGISWKDALAAGKVYNAKDGAAKLNLDAAGLNAKWSKLTRGKDLIKFGGGFYCGKVDGIYIMNGFYMSMRAAYCTPGEKIAWYTVQWSNDSLSWADFRGSVLGATDPATAAPGSVRRAIYDQYRALGLKAKPDTGDNGVHASASPLEALAERVNWLNADPTEDAFGKGLLAAGVSPETIAAWSDDCQVSVEGETPPGKTTSVFDTLEDLDADQVLEKAKKISQ